MLDLRANVSYMNLYTFMSCYFLQQILYNIWREKRLRRLLASLLFIIIHYYSLLFRA